MPGMPLLLSMFQTAEWTPLWSKFDAWSFANTPFIWCAMLDMGGGVGMFGDMQVISDHPLDALHLEGSSMVGVGIDPEGIDQNPPYYTMVLDTAWRAVRLDVDEWLQRWGVQRCGADSAKVKEAWSFLGKTVYVPAPPLNMLLFFKNGLLYSSSLPSCFPASLLPFFPSSLLPFFPSPPLQTLRAASLLTIV